MAGGCQGGVASWPAQETHGGPPNTASSWYCTNTQARGESPRECRLNVEAYRVNGRVRWRPAWRRDSSELGQLAPEVRFDLACVGLASEVRPRCAGRGQLGCF